MASLASTEGETRQQCLDAAAFFLQLTPDKSRSTDTTWLGLFRSLILINSPVWLQFLPIFDQYALQWQRGQSGELAAGRDSRKRRWAVPSPAGIFTLLPGSRLDDDVVMNCIQPVDQESNTCLLVDSMFLSSCMSGGQEDLFKLRTFIRDRIGESRTVLLPFHNREVMHWVLFVATHSKGRWHLQKLDSLSLPDSGDRESLKIAVVFGKDVTWDSSTGAQQDDHASCGVLVAVNARMIAHGVSAPRMIDADNRRADILDLFLHVLDEKTGDVCSAETATAATVHYVATYKRSSTFDPYAKSIHQKMKRKPNRIFKLETKRGDGDGEDESGGEPAAIDFVSVIRVDQYKKMKAAVVRPGPLRGDTTD